MAGNLRLRRSRSSRLAVASVAFLLMLTIYEWHRHPRDHHLELDSALSRVDTNSADSFSLDKNWVEICRKHRFPAFNRQRKVFDLVLFATELDWLEIRLHMYAPFVDHFVIIESPTTFTNRPKPLHLKQNWDRYKDFHHKIIYRVVEDPIVSTRHWDHEDWLRNALLNEVFPSLEGTPYVARKDDVLIVSDMDELLNPGALQLLRHCRFSKRITLRLDFYYYSFQWRHRGEQWAHPQATVYEGTIKNTVAPNDLRQNLLGPGLLPFAALSRWWEQSNLWNAGWHCSSCFATIQEMHTKMHSTSHQLWNTEQNRDVETMVYRVRHGLDLFGRPDQIYDRIDGNGNVPLYILETSESEGRFKYLLDRDGENAGFEDWKP